LIANSGWLAGAEAAALAFKAIESLVLAGALGVAGFGELAVVLAFVGAIARVLDFRAWETVIRYVVRFREDGDPERARATIKLCYVIDACSGLATFVVALVLAGLAADLVIHDPSAASWVRIFAITSLFSFSNSTSTALMRIADRYRAIAAQRAVIAALRLGGTAAVAVGSGSIETILVVYVVVSILDTVSCLALAAAATRALGLSGWFRVRFGVLRGHGRQLARFLAITNASALIKLLEDEADVLLIGAMLTAEAAGYYRLATTGTDVMLFPAGPVHSAVYPQMARMWHRGQGSSLRELLRKLQILMVAIAVVELAVVLIAAGPVIDLLYGAQYAGALPVLELLAVGCAGQVAFMMWRPFLLVADRPGGPLVSLLVATTCRVATIVLLAPEHGVVAVGIAHIVHVGVWAATLGPQAVFAFRQIPP
jgi:O-antigen/teichoic acid export membrane protein